MEEFDPSKLKATALDLDKIMLDPENPRLGDQVDGHDQKLLLEAIVETHGIEDVISSIAVNGYFTGEPILCRLNSKDEYICLEGNRRLTACLILAGDKRASSFDKMRGRYTALWEKNGRKSYDPVAAIVVPDDVDPKWVLSYLGVRHISGSQPWDSYAKAAWISKVSQGGELPLDQIALMVGDNHKTVAKLLEGYLFINQLINARLFDPSTSFRKGRGSVSQYPFSWVYTLLGFKSVRDLLELPSEKVSDPEVLKSPFALATAAKLLTAMFGNSAAGKDSLLKDSRELVNFASIVGNRLAFSKIDEAKSVSQLLTSMKPVDVQVMDAINEARLAIKAVHAELEEQSLDQESAISLVDPATRLHKSTSSLLVKIQAAASDK